MFPFFLLFHSHSHLEFSFLPPFKGFEDLGFSMNPTIHIESYFPAQYFPPADWLHVDFMGNIKDLILSLYSKNISSKSAPKMVYIKVCEVTNLHADILHCSVHDTLLMLGTHRVLDNSASKQNCITRHLITGSLGT